MQGLYLCHTAVYLVVCRCKSRQFLLSVCILDLLCLSRGTTTNTNIYSTYSTRYRMISCAAPGGCILDRLINLFRPLHLIFKGFEHAGLCKSAFRCLPLLLRARIQYTYTLLRCYLALIGCVLFVCANRKYQYSAICIRLSMFSSEPSPSNVPHIFRLPT